MSPRFVVVRSRNCNTWEVRPANGDDWPYVVVHRADLAEQECEYMNSWRYMLREVLLHACARILASLRILRYRVAKECRVMRPDLANLREDIRREERRILLARCPAAMPRAPNLDHADIDELGRELAAQGLSHGSGLGPDISVPYLG